MVHFASFFLFIFRSHYLGVCECVHCVSPFPFPYIHWFSFVMNTIPWMVYLCWGRVCTIYSEIHKRRMLSRKPSATFFFLFFFFLSLRCVSVLTKVDGKMGNLSCRRIFSHLLLLLLLVLVLSLSLSISISRDSWYMLNDLTDCAYANMHGRSAFWGLEKRWMTKIISVIEYMVLESLPLLWRHSLTHIPLFFPPFPSSTLWVNSG